MPLSTSPVLSVITVVLNAAEHLVTTRASIECAFTDSTRHLIEHIIIDGGSDAPTQAVLKKLNKDGTTVISEKDDGIYQAVNKGIKIARGAYVWVLHAGDYCPSDFTLNLLRHLCAEAGRSEKIYYFDCRVGDRFVTAPDTLTPAMALYNLSVSHQAILVPRSAYETIGYYQETFRIVSDHVWIRAAYLKGMGFEKIPKVYVQVDDSGLSSGRTVDSRELFRREIIQRTKMYFPFLQKSLCEKIFLARRSETARNYLRYYLETQRKPESADDLGWKIFKDALADYISIFEKSSPRQVKCSYSVTD